MLMSAHKLSENNKKNVSRHSRKHVMGVLYIDYQPSVVDSFYYGAGDKLSHAWHFLWMSTSLFKLLVLV